MVRIDSRKSAGEFLNVMVLQERNLTQKWLADEIGCTTRKISEICTNKRRISPMFALELEKAKNSPNLV